MKTGYRGKLKKERKKERITFFSFFLYSVFKGIKFQKKERKERKKERKKELPFFLSFFLSFLSLFSF